MSKIPTEVKKYILDNWETQNDFILKNNLKNIFKYEMSIQNIGQFRRRRKLNRRKVLGMSIKKCLNCKKEFKTILSREKKFCSNNCFYEFRKKENMKKKLLDLSDCEVKQFFKNYNTYIYSIIAKLIKDYKSNIYYDDIFSDINYRAINIINKLKKIPENKKKGYIKVCVKNVFLDNIKKQKDILVGDLIYE